MREGIVPNESCRRNRTERILPARAASAVDNAFATEVYTLRADRVAMTAAWFTAGLLFAGVFMTTEPTNFKELFRRSIAKVNELKAQLAARDAAHHEPIAVIGMACRLPGGGDSPEAFFQALRNGVDTVARLPSHRWLAEALQSDLPEAKWASLLASIEEFDAAFFGMSPREATHLDPQQRLLLEVAWESLENAGQPAERVAGTKTGVFVGLWSSDYQALMRKRGISGVYAGTGCLHSTASGRLSYALGLQGPCISVDTACSSSLVAIHLASQSLRLRDCDMALAGGVNVILDPESMKAAAEMRATSPDGHCKSFDASANGYVRGEGCAMVALKRLSDAQRDGDPILAVLVGSAVNQDGRSTGLTVPNVLAQQSLLRETLDKSGLAPSEIGYIETHGTGTSLGDPIEFEALRGVYGEPRPDESPCVLGAVKTNIGHTETAAGVTGFIKAVLCLQHQEIPRNLHFETLNPRISLDGTPFVIPTENTKWPAAAKPRRAGVSAFGISGTNAHVILQEAPSTEPKQESSTQQSSYVVTLSAKTSAALSAMADSYAKALATHTAALSDIAYTTSCRRSHLEHRLAITGQSVRDVCDSLAEFASGKASVRTVLGKAEQPAPQVVLVFSGQGAQWIGMGQELLAQSARFRDAVTACDRLIQQAGGCSVLAELARPERESLLHRTEVTQPALFAMQIGILAELRAFGVDPSLVIGHSVGEVAAAYAAGLLDLDTACRVVVLRSQAMKDQAGKGKMFAAELTESEALAALDAERHAVSLAAVNGPRSVVLAGDPAALQRVIKRLEQTGIVTREVRVDYAFHSPQMQEAEQLFLRSIGSISASRGTVKMISTVTGKELRAADCTAEYWGRNIRQPVRFAQAIAEAARVSGRVFVEVAPHPVLSTEIAEQLASVGSLSKGRIVPTLRRNQSERSQLLGAIAALYVQGVAVQWAAQCGTTQRVVSLPNYPWQRERYFIDAPKASTRQPGVASQYYDAVTKLVESVQDESTSADKHNLYLTFAPFAEILPGFSWMKIFARPQDHLDAVKLVQEKQVEMRQALFRHVDFSSCQRALDFGCGFSTDILHLAKQHANLTLDGYTISPEQAEVGRQRIEAQGLKSRVSVHCRDSAKDPFPGQYDVVFGFEVAHHIKDKAALFANIGEHLKPGGTLVLADFISHVAFEIEHDASSSFFLMVEQWTELLSAQGLKVQDVLDISRQISNFLHDPEFDTHLEQMRKAGEDENVLVSFQSYDRLGKMLDRGLASYILLSATKVTDASKDALLSHNREQLSNLLAYVPPSSRQVEESEESQLLYRVEWRRSSLPAESVPSDGWLLIAEQGQTTAQLAQLLAHKGVRSVQVQAGDRYEQLGVDHYRLPLTNESLRKLLHSAFGFDKPCTRVVFLSALDQQSPGPQADLSASVAGLCGAATSVVQALVAHGFRSPPRLYLVTQGAVAVDASGPIRVEQSALCGLGKTIALEHPELRCTRLDVDPAAPIAADVLLRELGGADREDQITLRGGDRYVARLTHSPGAWTPTNQDSLSIRSDRSYLITGGLGGLGLTVARWLVQRGAGQVFLVSRHAAVASAQRTIQELNANGARVVAVSADVSSSQQVAGLFAQIKRSGMPLAGIVHAAGVLHDKTLVEQSTALFAEVLLPKAQGAWNLHQHSQAESLDFFVMYSSAASLCGSPGQANYCAANAFLDALAQQRRLEGKPAVSIQWGAFSEVGMAAAKDNRGKRVAGMGVASLTPEEGLTFLERLAVGTSACIGVMRLNARQLVETMPSSAGLPFFSDLAKGAGGPKRLGKASQKMMEALQAASAAERSRLLIAHLCEQFGAVLQQEPSRIDPSAPFQSMGVDSLMSLEIRNRLEETLGVRLGATVLYTYASLTALCQHVLERLGLAEDEAARSASADARSVLSDSTKIEQLSDEALAEIGKALLSH